MACGSGPPCWSPVSPYQPTAEEFSSTAGRSVAGSGEAVGGVLAGRHDPLCPGGRRHPHADLGGIGKGWAADQIAAQLAPFGPCLVDFGGDIAARGKPWSVDVAEPGQHIGDGSRNGPVVSDVDRMRLGMVP